MKHKSVGNKNNYNFYFYNIFLSLQTAELGDHILKAKLFSFIDKGQLMYPMEAVL